jgi:hypothetical protein
MTRSHVLLHCSNARIVAARQEALGNTHTGSIRVLLSYPCWEKRLLNFLDLSGVGRIMGRRRNPSHEDGRVDYLGCEGGHGQRARLICFFS